MELLLLALPDSQHEIVLRCTAVHRVESVLLCFTAVVCHSSVEVTAVFGLLSVRCPLAVGGLQLCFPTHEFTHVQQNSTIFLGFLAYVSTQQ